MQLSNLSLDNQFTIDQLITDSACKEAKAFLNAE